MVPLPWRLSDGAAALAFERMSEPFRQPLPRVLPALGIATMIHQLSFSDSHSLLTDVGSHLARTQKEVGPDSDDDADARSGARTGEQAEQAEPLAPAAAGVTDSPRLATVSESQAEWMEVQRKVSAGSSSFRLSGMRG